MAVDMMAAIEREMARQRRTARSATPHLDIVSEAMRYAKEDKIFKERKNEQMRSIIDMRTQGFESQFNNDLLNKDISKYESWYNSNRSKLDDVTLEYAQIKLDDMKQHKQENEEFDGLEGQLQLRKKKMFKTLDTIDKSGEKLTAGDINLIRESNQEWLNYTRSMQKRFGDRLNMKTFDYLQNDLNEAVGMNTFLLESAKDDGWIDENEYTAFKDSWDQLDPTPILTYLKKEDVHDKSVTQGLQERMDSVAEEYKMLRDFVTPEGEVSKGKFPSPDGSINLSWEDDLDADQKMEYLNKLHNMQKQIEGWDDQYKSLNIGQSFIENYVPDFYGAKKDDKVYSPLHQPGVDKKKKKGEVVPPTNLSGFEKRMTNLNTEKDEAKARYDDVDELHMRMIQSSDMKRKHVFADFDEKRTAGFKYDKDTGRWTSWKDVELSPELMDHMEKAIKRQATRWGVDRALRLKKLWEEFVKARKSYDKNRTVEDVKAEMLELKKAYIG